MTRLPIVVAGEALVDVVVPAVGETSSAVGGSPLNVAVGLARLEVPALLITRVGDDEYGRWIADHVRESGAELSASAVVPGTTTSTATARLDEEQVARYEFELVWDLDHHVLPEARALHVGSLGAMLPPGRNAVDDLVRQAQEQELFVSYDPNVRSSFVTDPAESWREVAEIASRCRLVKVSDEDLEILRPGVPHEDLARELLRGGITELVVVTHGPGGASAYAPDCRVEVSAPPIEVVDTVGAGDAFMAGLLAALSDWDVYADGPGALGAMDEDRVALLLRGAMAVAAVTCTRRGANPPRRQELPPTWPL
ncbi:MAG TPA: carbohydrate kinase [Nocardioidaceae bacterium]|nr:carbohydrate kinase [Nocardioidaceae bacterium]